MYSRSYIVRRMLESLFRHRVPFLIGVIGVTAIVLTAAWMRGRTYVATASTQVIPETAEVTSVLGINDNSYESPAQQQVDRFNDLLKDDMPGGFLDTALKNAHLDRPIDVDPRAHDVRLDRLMQRVYAATDGNDVFEIGLTGWENQGECERIVRALQTLYITEAGQSRQAQSIATATFLDGQIALYQKRMRVAEQALIEYKQHHFGDLPEAESSEIEQMARLKSERDMLQISAHDYALRQQALQRRLAAIKPTTVFQQTVASDPSLMTPTQRALSDLQTRRSGLIAQGWLPTSTPVQSLDAQIARLRPMLAHEHTDQMVQTTTRNNPEYQTLTQQITENSIEQQTAAARDTLLAQQIAAYEKDLEQLPSSARELTDRTRDYTILKSEYESLLERREQARIKASLDRVAATSTLNPIGVVYARSSAGGRKIAGLGIGGILLGLVTGIGLVLLAEWLDPTLRYVADAERLLGVPVLGTLPEIRGKKADAAQAAIGPPWHFAGPGLSGGETSV